MLEGSWWRRIEALGPLLFVLSIGVAIGVIFALSLPEANEQSAKVGSALASQTADDIYFVREDLKAQQAMAHWAFLLLLISVATLCVTSLGVWFVKRTLDATLQAVSEAGSGTKEMIEANAIARRSQEHQLAAYLVTDSLDRERILDVPNGKTQLILRVRFKNVGHTPAESAKFICGVAWDREPTDLAQKDWDFSGIADTSIGPTIVVDAPNVLVDDQDVLETYKGKKKLFLFGIASYRDIFDRHRSTGFLWQVSFSKSHDSEVPDRTRWVCVGNFNYTR